MGRKKTEELDLEMDMGGMAVATEPVPVKIVPEQRVNPDIGKFPIEGQPRPTKKYRFTYNQQPGTPMEFTRGLTCLSKGTGRRKNEFFKYKIEDGDDVELPVEIAEFLMGLTYFEDGRSRPRCTLVPIS
jgi:hypothetical protein